MNEEDEVSAIPDKLRPYFIIDFMGYLHRPTTNKDHVVGQRSEQNHPDKEDGILSSAKAGYGVPPSSIIVFAGRQSLAIDSQSRRCTCGAGLRGLCMLYLSKRTTLPCEEQENLPSGPHYNASNGMGIIPCTLYTIFDIP